MIKLVVGLVAVVVLATAGYVVISGSGDNNQSRRAPAGNEQTPANQPSASQPGSGQYVDYSADVIASTSGTKVLFFHAPWCPQCRALEADIKAQGVPAGVSIIKVDYDSNQSLRQKYGVTLQTTFVKVDDQGSLVQKYVAYDEPNLESVKRNLL